MVQIKIIWKSTIIDGRSSVLIWELKSKILSRLNATLFNFYVAMFLHAFAWKRQMTYSPCWQCKNNNQMANITKWVRYLSEFVIWFFDFNQFICQRQRSVIFFHCDSEEKSSWLVLLQRFLYNSKKHCKSYFSSLWLQ